jgi:death-on-curing protein
VRYLEALDAVAINARVLGYTQGAEVALRDEGLLESALMRPRMAAHYEGIDMVDQAALLMAGIALAHAFIDGNKRTALVCGVTFLEWNGYRVTAEGELGRRIEELVTSHADEIAAIKALSDWLRERAGGGA